MKQTTYGLLLITQFFVGFAIGRYGTIPPVKAESVPVKTEACETQTMRVTAYCPCAKCCGKWADGITANGHRIRPGDRFVAAPRSIPFGKMVIVPGYNQGRPAPVLDRGGAIKDGRLDLYFDTHQEALKWGVKYVEVAIVKGEG